MSVRVVGWQALLALACTAAAGDSKNSTDADPTASGLTTLQVVLISLGSAAAALFLCSFIGYVCWHQRQQHLRVAHTPRMRGMAQAPASFAKAPVARGV